MPFGPGDPGPAARTSSSAAAPTPSCSAWWAATSSPFNREFARAGLDRRVVRLSGALEENGLYALGGDATGELYATCPPSPPASAGADEGQLALQERHARRAGAEAPVVCAYARGVYDGVRLAGALLSAAAGHRRPSPAARLARANGLAFGLAR